MIHLTWMLTGVSIGLSTAIAFFVAADRGLSGRLRATLIGLAISGAAYSVLASLPAAGTIRTVFLMLAAPGIILLWVAVRALFDDGFEIGGRLALPAAALALLPAIRFVSETARPLIPVAITLVAATLGAHLLWLLITGRGDDLDTFRRRLRLLFAGAGSIYALVAIGVALLFRADRPTPSIAFCLIAAQVLIKVLWLMLTAGHPSPLHRLAPPLLPAGTEGGLPTEAPPPEPSVSCTELDRVRMSMEKDRFYRRTGLSIGDLSQELGLPEHRLRALIHEGLGFRNFNAFLNHYRLAEIAARLRNPHEDHFPILTIALETGYGSIGPFNRAFRDTFGMTPTEFRRSRGAPS